MKTIEISKNIKLHNIHESKFKKTTFNLYIHRPLNKDEVTKNALLPFVLKRGCEKAKNSSDIAKYLEELYGADFNVCIEQMGEDQIISFSFRCIDDRYVPDNSKLVQKVFKLMLSMVFQPVVENDGFKAEYVRQEKHNLKDLIESIVNDKRTYAKWRCLEKMCADEAYGIYKYGKVQDLEFINEKNLYEHYKNIIRASKIDIFVCGDTDIKPLEGMLKELSGSLNEFVAEYPKTTFKCVPEKPHYFEDKMDVNQSKLSLGFRHNIAPSDSEYYVLTAFFSVFGFGTNSKLFNNVREKLSLAYYVSLSPERFKGIVQVDSGIEFKNYQRAYDEIIAQLDEVKKGNVTDDEMDVAINAMVNSLESVKDEQASIISFYFGQKFANNDTIDSWISKIKSVKKEEVVKVAEKIKLDTIYFLTGIEGGAK